MTYPATSAKMLKSRIVTINRIYCRWLNLQEYQSKELMNKFGLLTQKFKIIGNASEAEKAANDLSKPSILQYVHVHTYAYTYTFYYYYYLH